MLIFIGLLLLVIAVSIDSFGVGVTYGMQKIRVPVIALIIIMVCSGAVLLTSMLLGNVLEMFLSVEIAKMIGGFILITIGLFSLANLIIANIKKKKQGSEAQPTSRFGEITTVLATPDKADLDNSGTISVSEALLLGFALALDAFGAGIGASLLGYSPIITAVLIAGMSGIFLSFGMRIGLLLAKNKKLQKLSFLPPTLLIGLGILNLI
ncbi:sporulation membrane protein YtaF [Oceanobacillus piezotolerans]|uniref:Sporulation membrane protein YtaF n=1 Tax=Oceanobacillus piezotolerans TaxID=2448030 RepID=A0A498D8L6_9BACI|nr:sporulation membrane protein YtaF [Oceanobacillus piezotolerans]RLL46733.1 sporulation membrane protein YtaF [Oceanobacillus piezotolerans]